MTICTRFPPSPTGDLHIGGVRTALFSWLYAKKHHGQFILRIEDTDRERSTESSVQAILEGMKWLGLNHDQGPFFQTQRFDRYHQVIEQLMASGHAYRCYCSKERLDNLRAQQMADKHKPRYDGHCRDQSQQNTSKPHVIRFKNPHNGSVSWDDSIKGQITIDNRELDDLIIQRSDGSPTYNLTVVVDDWDMEITHVLRGDDHINNTPRQINLLKALGANIPQYGHIPMILGEDGKRLSKRHGALSIMAYKKCGYLPQALLNYLVRLGWSCGDQEFFSLEQMIEKFSLEHINRSPAALNLEKLKWLNQHYIKTLPVDMVKQQAEPLFKQQNIELNDGPELEALISLFSERVHTLTELVDQTSYFFQPIETYDEKAKKKHLSHKAIAPLERLQQKLPQLIDWHAQAIHQAIIETTETLEISMGKVGMPLRVAITGGSNSPAIDQVAELLGKKKVLSRIEKALSLIQLESDTEPS